MFKWVYSVDKARNILQLDNREEQRRCRVYTATGDTRIRHSVTLYVDPPSLHLVYFPVWRTVYQARM